MQQKKIYRQVPNFNLIPAEYQKPTISFQRFLLRLLLILIIIVDVSFISILYNNKSTSKAAIDSTQQKIQQMEEQLATINAGNTGAKELEATIEALRQERLVVEDDWKALTTQADWSRVMTAFFLSKPQGVRLSSVVQDGVRVNATGTVSDYATLIEYRRLLLASPAISRIISLQSSKVETTISFSLAVEVKMGGE